MRIVQLIKRAFGWLRNAHRFLNDDGRERLDAIYPDRRRATGAEAATNAAISSGWNGGLPGAF